MKKSEVLLSQWEKEIPSPERHAVSARIPVSDYQRILALKSLYGDTRSVNDIFCDLVGAMLDEVEDSLPVDHYDERDVEEMLKDEKYCFSDPRELLGVAHGPKANFKRHLDGIRKNDIHEKQEEMNV